MAEIVARSAALLALLLWIANAWRPRDGVGEDVRLDRLADVLPRLTASKATDSVHVRLDSVPDETARDWLAALRRAGVGVSWSGQLAPVGLETYVAADPAGSVIVLAAGGEGSVVGDVLGAIDTISVGQKPAMIRVADVQGRLTLASGSQPARAAIAPRGAPKRVMVSGPAGWEAKFIVAALEESGWVVDAHLRVGPGDVVGQASPPPPDTSRDAAVVIVDSSGPRIPNVDRFVRQGGGLVLVGDANRMRAVGSLVSWRAARREIAPLGTLPGDTTWRGQSRLPLDTVGDARVVVLEQRGDHATVVARRHYRGRVIGTGYDETWRWRMAGGANSVTEHRAWWSRLVSGVALRDPAPANVVTGAAPVATLHASLGPPSEPGASLASALPRELVSNILGALILVSLLTEWLLRRSRGAR